jgi:hypothetical protein
VLAGQLVWCRPGGQHLEQLVKAWIKRTKLAWQIRVH